VWSLTWQDVNEQFTKSKMDTRNPFVEQLQAQMQPLQKQLSEEFELGVLRKVPVQSAFDQLLDYLEAPNEIAWRHLAFVHAMGWFDQSSMMDEKMVSNVIANFKEKSSTQLEQVLDNITGAIAVGWLSLVSDKDPLTVRCVLPIEALTSKDTESMLVNICLDTTVCLDEKANQQAWAGFIHLYNLFQFLPFTCFVSADGLKAGLYERIQWRNHSVDPVAEELDAPRDQLIALLEDTLEELREGLKQLAEKKLALPDVLLELQKEDGEIIAEAELVWHEHKLVGLLEEQLIYSELFEISGWNVLALDEQGLWAEKAEQYLKNNKGFNNE